MIGTGLELYPVFCINTLLLNKHCIKLSLYIHNFIQRILNAGLLYNLINCLNDDYGSLYLINTGSTAMITSFD